MEYIKSIFFFMLAGLFEIGGGYLMELFQHSNPQTSAGFMQHMEEYSF